jgi:hypothetical protein
MTVASIAEIARGLSDEAESVIAALYPGIRIRGARVTLAELDGEPGDHISIWLKGDRPGRWCDFRNRAIHGDLLDLVAQAKYGGDKGQAVQWARRFLGLDRSDPAALAVERRAALKRAEQRKAEAVREERKRIGQARRIWAVEAQADLEGTPVDLYLLGRALDLRQARSTGALRYHPELFYAATGELMPAMVATMIGPDGHIAAVHRTYLEPDGQGGFQKYAGGPAKLMLGCVTGSYIPISKGDYGVPLRRAPEGAGVIVCEGIETGLAFAIAAPRPYVIATGSLSNLPALPATIGTRFLAREADDKPAALKGFDRMVEFHQRQCADVRIIAPIPGFKDGNDVLMGRRQGG